jgi:CHASE2 domain-containing sensor protein
MLGLFATKCHRELEIWRSAALPGLMVLLVVIIARLFGSLQVLEWMMLDKFLRLRPAEPIDERVVIIGIDENDITKVGQYPIPDGEIADLLNKLETYKPRTIGLDIFKNFPVQPGRDRLIQTFQNNPNILSIKKLINPTVPPPNFVSEERIGIVDVHNDKDGKNRRYILWSPHPDEPKNDNKDGYSLALRLAENYLKGMKISLETGIKDQDTIRFNHIELPRIVQNFGGYVDKIHPDDFPGELEILMNFRQGKKPFRIISLEDIKTDKFDPNWLHNRIILIGNFSISVGDNLYTLATPGMENAGQIYGVEYHAHAVSQIVSAVLDNRPLLHVWEKNWEYLWIVIWGITPIAIGRFTQSIRKNLLGVSLVGFLVIGSAYISLLVWGVWIPVVPSILTLAINGVGLSAFAFYQNDKLMRSKIDERQQTLENTFNLIHNGPLQTLASGLRDLREQDLPNEKLIFQFEKLNYEIREIGDFLKLEALTNNESLRLGSGLKLDLKRPVHDLFYEVYTSTLERDDLKYLETLKVKTRTFEPIDDKYLSMDLKRELCIFLEESLCNVGKHARGVKRVEATGICVSGIYELCIKDNGSGLSQEGEHRGTKHSKKLAWQLNGDFQREAINPQGTLCQLTWELTKNG